MFRAGPSADRRPGWSEAIHRPASTRPAVDPPEHLCLRSVTTRRRFSAGTPATTTTRNSTGTPKRDLPQTAGILAFAWPMRADLPWCRARNVSVSVMAGDYSIFYCE